MSRTACAKCGADLEQPTTGRPRTYCGPVCRRAGESELRRLQRQLESAEQSVLVARRSVEFGPGNPDYQRRRLAFEQQRLADLEERLRALLGDPEVKGEPQVRDDPIRVRLDALNVLWDRLGRTGIWPPPEPPCTPTGQRLKGKLSETELTFGDVRFAITRADVKSAS